MIEDKKPILIFELGHLQVFCYQTIAEWSSGRPPHEFFWQKKGDSRIRGPFHNLYTTVNDYSMQIALEKDGALKDTNIIPVDFKIKKRLL